MQEDEAVPGDAYTRIQHTKTKYWLHATNNDDANKITRSTGNNEVFGLARTSTGSGKSINNAAKIQWDGADLHRLVFSKQPHFQDAFSLHKVPEENAFAVGFMSGCVPILRQYCRRRQRRELTMVDAADVTSTLNELTQFQFIHGIEIKSRQKLLRDLKIVELLIKLLQVPFSQRCLDDSPRNAAVKALLKNVSDDAIHDYNEIVEQQHIVTMVVVNAAFRVLDSFLKGNSRKNELYISRHVPFLWSMFGTEMRVEPMFNELIRDNMQIIRLCGKEEIMRIINLLSDNKCADFLEFLSVLSVCEGMPVKDMQDQIGEHLLSVKTPPVYLTDVSSNMDGTVDVRMDNTKPDALPLHVFANDALDERDETSTPEYLFLQRQLELYGNLCTGRHETNIKYITETHKHLTWEECMIAVQSDGINGDAGNGQSTTSILFCPLEHTESTAILKSPEFEKRRKEADIIIGSRALSATDQPKLKKVVLNKLPQSLRSIYVDIMVSMFVDVGQNRDVLSEVDLSFDWDKLTVAADDAAADDQTMALSGARFEHFPELKRWIFQVLDGTKAMIHTDTLDGQPKNRMLRSVLNLLHYLIVFGYYADPKDIVELMNPLKGVINGTNDYRDKDQVDIAPRSRVDGGEEGSKELAYSEWLNNARYQTDDDHGRIVCDAKVKALTCVEALYNFVFNVRLRCLVCDFKLVFGMQQKVLQKANKQLKLAAEDEERRKMLESKNFRKMLSELTENSVKLTPEITERARSYLANVSEQSNWVTSKTWRLQVLIPHLRASITSSMALSSKKG